MPTFFQPRTSPDRPGGYQGIVRMTETTGTARPLHTDYSINPAGSSSRGALAGAGAFAIRPAASAPGVFRTPPPIMVNQPAAPVSIPGDVNDYGGGSGGSTTGPSTPAGDAVEAVGAAAGFTFAAVQAWLASIPWWVYLLIALGVGYLIYKRKAK